MAFRAQVTRHLGRMTHFVIVILGASAAVGSPFTVDSTSIASDIELKVALEQRSAADKRTFIAPKLAAAFPLHDDLELEVASSHRYVERGQSSEDGPGDSAIELKWRIGRESEHRPAVAIAPEISVPTGSRRAGLGSGNAALALPLIVEKTFSAMRLSGELSYAREFGGEEESFLTGALLTFRPRNALVVGVEVTDEMPRHRLADDAVSGNIGFKWDVTSRAEIHGLVGHTLRTADDGPSTRWKLVLEMHL